MSEDRDHGLRLERERKFHDRLARTLVPADLPRVEPGEVEQAMLDALGATLTGWRCWRSAYGKLGSGDFNIALERAG